MGAEIALRQGMTSHARSPKVSAPVTRIDRSADGTVQSLTRAMQLLELLAEDDEGFRLVDIAAHSGLSTSTAHRLLTTLEQRQFVQFDRESSLWFVGCAAFRWALRLGGVGALPRWRCRPCAVCAT
jgi:IclR family acetate operon transcriptional repressor